MKILLALKIGKIAYFSGLKNGDGAASRRHDENRHGVQDVVVQKPQAEREELEDVERVQHFQEEKRENTLHGHHDLIVAVQSSPAKKLCLMVKS